MFERFKSALRVMKESGTWPAILSTGIRGPMWMSANYEAFAREGYVWNADVYACVRAKINAMQGFKFRVYQVKGTGRKLIEDGDLVKLLKRPNPRQSWSELAGQWMGSKCISGNAYLEGVSIDGRESETVKNPPRELYCIRPDRVFVVTGNELLPIAGFQYTAGAKIINYPAQMWRDPQTKGFVPRNQILHSKYWHPLDDFYGLSPIQAASRNVDSTNSAVAHNVALTQNFARPAGVFTVPEKVNVEQAEQWTNMIRQKFSGPSNAGRPMVLSAGMTWEQMGLTPVEMDWLKSLEHNTGKICSIFGVPPEIIGDSSNRTYSNFAEARKFFYLETMLPEAQSFCDDLNSWLTPLFAQSMGAELEIGIDREAIEAIQEDRQIIWQNAKDGTGFLQVNEQRSMVGLDPVPEGDVIMVPVGMVPLSVSSKQRQMPNQQPPTPANKPQPDDKPKPGAKKSVELPKELPPGSFEEHLAQVKKRVNLLQ